MGPLTEQQIADRVELRFAVDAQACESCGRSAIGKADDPTWYVDGILHRDADGAFQDQHGPYSIHAEIRCPECW